MEAVRCRLARTAIRDGWEERVAAEHAEVNDPATGNVCNAERLHAERWWEAPREGEEPATKHKRIFRTLLAQHQTVRAFVKGQHEAHKREGYDLNLIAKLDPKPLDPAMEWRTVVVGYDYRDRPIVMGYFHVEEVLASMATEPTLRGHWITRAEARYEDVEHRVCQCTRLCDPPCTKASTDGGAQHGVRTTRQRVYQHAMDCDAAIDAQRRMEAAQRNMRDPKNWLLMAGGGLDKAKLTQWGGTVFPLYWHPLNLDEEVAKSEKACHLAALIQEPAIDPEEAAKPADPVFGGLRPPRAGRVLGLWHGLPHLDAGSGHAAGD